MNPLVSLGLRALAIAVLLGLIHHHGDHAGYTRGHAELVAYQVKVTDAALSAQTAARTEESRRDKAQKDAADETQRLAQLDRARRAGTDARVASADERLQHHTDAVAARGRDRSEDPAAAGECQAATATLADVFGACRRALRQLGRDDDEFIADLTQRVGECAARYDALTPP